MSRLNDPLDAFEMDEFDYPVFEAPARLKTGARASRPAAPSSRSSRTSPPRSAPAPRRPSTSAPRTHSNSDRSPAARANAGSNRSGANGSSSGGSNRNGARPQTQAGNSRPQSRPNATASSVAPGVQRVAKPGEKRNTPNNRRATPVPTPPRRLLRPKASLRAVHYEVAGVLLFATGILFGYAALQTSVDGWLPRQGLSAGRLLFGAGAIVIPCAFIYLGVTLFVRRQNANLRAFWRGAGTAFAVFLTWKALQVPAWR